MAIEEERKAKIKLTQEQLDRVCERHKRFPDCQRTSASEVGGVVS
jgi:hypothetical protein